MRRLGFLFVIPFVLACNGSSGRPPDGFDGYRLESEGPVWGRVDTLGRVRTIFWDVPADEEAMVSPERVALRRLGPDLGVFDVDNQTRVIGTFPMAPAGTVTVFQLTQLGVDVVGAQIRVVRVGDRIRFVTAQLPETIALDVEPMITPEDAAAGLPEQLGLEMTPPMSEPRLLVWDSLFLTEGFGEPRLAWEIDVAARPGGGRAYVSAIDGTLLTVLPTRERFADVWFVRQSEDDFAFTGPMGVRDAWYTAAGGAQVDAPPAEPAATAFMEATAAHMDAEALRMWWLENAGFDGYDGQGTTPNVFVGFSPSCDDCPGAWYGGEDYTVRDPATDPLARYFVFSTGAYSTDVFAHEYLHAVLDHFTVGDVFNHAEPAAVEESLADTFAAFFDTDSPWVVGDALAAPMQRDLRTPAATPAFGCDAQPETVGEWIAPAPLPYTCTGSAAGECTSLVGGVCFENTCQPSGGHCQSSIASLAAYRFTDGAMEHDVVGVGVPKARAIYVSALALVGYHERFVELRDHLLAACHLWAESEQTPLGADGPVTGEDCGDLINAWFSVGVGRLADSDRDGWDDGTDNCPLVANFDQADVDDDRVGDACPASD